MAKTTQKLEWCIVKPGNDMNWWVTEISDPIRWDVDGLGVIDPRQITHIIDTCDLLREYGFDHDLIRRAFYPFRIEKELKDGTVRLARVNDDVLETEDALFALPDILDEEKGPYADFLDQITKKRVKLLNDLIDFEQKFTIDELEDEIRERQNAELMEGLPVHPFNEVISILEFVPDGFELDEDEDVIAGGDDEDLGDIPDFDDEDEKIEEDDTMKWDEDEDEESDEDEEENEEDEEVVEEKPKRKRKK